MNILKCNILCLNVDLRESYPFFCQFLVNKSRKMSVEFEKLKSEDKILVLLDMFIHAYMNLPYDIFFYRFFGISKSDSSQTYTATVIPAGCAEDYPHQSTITEVTSPKDSRREADNEKEGTEDSSTTVVYKDTGKAMKASNSQTSESLQATGGRGVNSQEQSPNLSVNTQYIISPDEKNKRPGLALIITGQKFAIGNGDFRNGAEKDLRNMFETFYNLNFEVRWEPFANKTTEDLKNELIKCKYIFT